MLRRACVIAGVLVCALVLMALGGWIASGRVAGGPRLLGGTGRGIFGSCCGGGVAAGSLGGGAGTGSVGAGGSAATGLDALQKAAVDAYRAGTGDQSEVEAKLTNYGCHIQADIYKAGERVGSYAWRGTGWQEIK